MQIDLAESLVMKRSKGVCESLGCKEVHGSKAKTFKGRVFLIARHKIKKESWELKDMVAVCWKCSVKMDLMLHNKRNPIAKKHNPKQTSLFDNDMGIV